MVATVDWSEPYDAEVAPTVYQVTVVLGHVGLQPKSANRFASVVRSGGRWGSELSLGYLEPKSPATFADAARRCKRNAWSPSHVDSAPTITDNLANAA